ncbi:MAG: flagellar assembly protein FliW [Anaerotignum sp.]
MQLKTKYFSDMNVNDEDIILFKHGLFGFEDFKKFILIKFENNDSSPLCLQSVDDENVAFVIINPTNFIPDYSISLEKSDYKELKLEDLNKLAVYTICVLKDNIPESTTNLRCPIILNAEAKLAKQIVLDNAEYPFKYTFEELMNKEG